jgi:hypothetical protein
MDEPGTIVEASRSGEEAWLVCLRSGRILLFDTDPATGQVAARSYMGSVRLTLDPTEGGASQIAGR